MNTGCKDCSERMIGCHANCEKYENYIKEKNKINAERKKFSENKRIAVESKIRKVCESKHYREGICGYSRKR